MICLDIFGQRSPWLLLFGDKWTVPDASWLLTRGGSLTALHSAKALWPPKEGMGLLIRVPNICSVPRTLKGRSLLGLDAPLAPVPKAVLHCQSWVVHVSAAGTHLRGGGTGELLKWLGWGGLWVRHPHTCLSAPGSLKHEKLPRGHSSAPIHCYISHLAWTRRRPQWGCFTAQAR